MENEKEESTSDGKEDENEGAQDEVPDKGTKEDEGDKAQENETAEEDGA